MKFSDIDFSAISKMMDNMTDEQKAQVNDMAQNMMNDYQQKTNEEEVVDVDIYEFLHISEEEYAELPGAVLDYMEQAVELFDFYSETPDTDYSASMLFYSKAVLTMLRTYIFPIYKNVLQISTFTNANTTTLYQYVEPLMNEENIHRLVDEDFGSTEHWMELRNMLQQLYIQLNRAEYDTISHSDILQIQALLFDQKQLLNITTLK